MWLILESHEVDKICSRVPKEILKRYEKWKDILQFSGPAGLKLIKGFYDEKLSGGYVGYRSSRLNEQWRVIYKIEKDRALVRVIKISAHDYRRR